MRLQICDFFPVFSNKNRENLPNFGLKRQETPLRRGKGSGKSACRIPAHHLYAHRYVAGRLAENRENSPLDGTFGQLVRPEYRAEQERKPLPDKTGRQRHQQGARRTDSGQVSGDKPRMDNHRRRRDVHRQHGGAESDSGLRHRRLDAGGHGTVSRGIIRPFAAQSGTCDIRGTDAEQGDGTGNSGGCHATAV